MTRGRSGLSCANDVTHVIALSHICNILAYVLDDLTETDTDLFGSLFVFTQQLTLRVEERLAQFGLTSRQWLLLGVLEKAFPGHAPTVSEMTEVFGTTRQNVKQVAAQLERKGWVRLERDQIDRRAVRLVLTERIEVFHDPAVQADQAAFIRNVFGGLTAEERRAFVAMVTNCIGRLSPPLDDASSTGRKSDERP